LRIPFAFGYEYRFPKSLSLNAPTTYAHTMSPGRNGVVKSG
jgi:hypothetical protein